MASTPPHSLSLPDYDVDFTILTADLSSTANVQIISDILATIFVPALEMAAKQEAEQIYAGTYTATTSSLTVVTDRTPGLSITNWTENGTDVLPLIGTLLGVSAAQHS